MIKDKFLIYGLIICIMMMGLMNIISDIQIKRELLENRYAANYNAEMVSTRIDAIEIPKIIEIEKIIEKHTIEQNCTLDANQYANFIDIVGPRLINQPWMIQWFAIYWASNGYNFTEADLIILETHLPTT